jgi:hypothetical protein
MTGSSAGKAGVRGAVSEIEVATKRVYRNVSPRPVCLTARTDRRGGSVS